MPSLGPSLLFATGLALGVGAGVLVPRKAEKAGPVPPIYTPPPPPSGEKREIGKLATPTGGVALAGGFPGELFCLLLIEIGSSWADRRQAPYQTSSSARHIPPLMTGE